MMNSFYKQLTTVILALIASQPIFSQHEKPRSKLTIHVDKPGKKISPLLYGVFFEEINRSGDGGLYAEMILNRSFEDSRGIASNRKKVPQKPALFPDETWDKFEDVYPVYGWWINEGVMKLDSSVPLNNNNPTALKVNFDKKTKLTNSGVVPIRSAPGTNGIGLNIVKSATYLLSLYIRSESFPYPLFVRLESNDGQEVLAEQEIKGITKSWKKFQVKLKAIRGDSSGRLAITSSAKGTVFLDMVSLFPEATWNNRPNGLRNDLMVKVVNLKPAFVRFPGGCFVEGDYLKDAVNWKSTIGDVAERPGTWTYRGYMSTDGLGMHEYLLMCEDLKAEPLFVINAGMSHQEQRTQPTDTTGMQRFVQDALDAIEYCNGPASTKWGRLRAKAGHPKPFHLKYIEIGNENSRAAYTIRYPLFYKAIKERYPEINIISNVAKISTASKEDMAAPVDIVDDHYYYGTEKFIELSEKYDQYNRNGPKVYVGEYAVTSRAGKGNLNAALGEAVFMIGMERNADHVIMSSYAPLFRHYHWLNWNPDAIIFDQYRVYGTPSYSVQELFGNHRPDVLLALESKVPLAASRTRAGGIGFGTRGGQAEFKDIQILKNGKELLNGPMLEVPKTGFSGKWILSEGLLSQTSHEQVAQLFLGYKDWQDCAIYLKARSLTANAFQITFSAQDRYEKSHWTIGENQAYSLEIGDKVLDQKNGHIEKGRWYDLKIELQDGRIKCYLNDKLIHDVLRPGTRALFATAGLDQTKGEVVIKVVNPYERPVETEIDLKGIKTVAQQGKMYLLAGNNPLDENSFESPDKIKLTEETFSVTNTSFRYVFKPYSVTVARLKINE